MTRESQRCGIWQERVNVVVYDKRESTLWYMTRESQRCGIWQERVNVVVYNKRESTLWYMTRESQRCGIWQERVNVVVYDKRESTLPVFNWLISRSETLFLQPLEFLLFEPPSCHCLHRLSGLLHWIQCDVITLDTVWRYYIGYSVTLLHWIQCDVITLDTVWRYWF